METKSDQEADLELWFDSDSSWKHNVFGTSVSFSVNQEFVLGYYVPKQDLM